jgi:hypothetical protein
MKLFLKFQKRQNYYESILARLDDFGTQITKNEVISDLLTAGKVARRSNSESSAYSTTLRI